MTLGGLTERDYGVPMELCREQQQQQRAEPAGGQGEEQAGSEVFVREYSKSTVTVDCKNWQSTIVMKEEDAG